MSESNNESVSPQGHSITYETIAGGKIRPKVKIWFDHTYTEMGAKNSAELYEQTLNEMRKKGFVIDGDQNK